MHCWIFCAFFLAPQAPSQAPPPTPPAAEARGNPVLEAGGTYHQLWNGRATGLGSWRTVHGSLSWQPPLRVRPRFDVERQWRPGGTHVRGSAGVYVDWTSGLYSYQAITIAPSTSPESRFYPSRRGDARVFWKVPRHPAVTIAGGYTALTFGSPQRSHIVNVGTLIYTPRVITQATLYVNRNEPGGLRSAAANLSIQVGAEGTGWYGVSISGGRELYRLGTLATEGTADFTTGTVGLFTRRWLTRSAGIHATGEYQRTLGSYSRVAVTAHFFVGL